MKILSKLSAVLATRFMRDEFQKARLKLTALYVLIIAIILAIFSGFLYFQVIQQVNTFTVTGQSGVFISADRAANTARRVSPEAGVLEVEEEIVDGRLFYVVELLVGEAETEVYIDRITGEIVDFSDQKENALSFEQLFLDDFEESILVANLVILLLSGLLSFYLAGRTLRPIAEKMRQQEQFSNDVAHELRTPLSALYAAVGAVLRREETNETYKSALNDVQVETKRLIDLTEDLLLTARGKATAAFTAVSLTTTLTAVIDRLQVFADERNVKLVTHFEVDAVVPGDQTMLERAFSNLIHNAIKFSDVGGTVTVRVRKDGQIEIIDTGSGIPDQQQDKVFDRFYSTNTARDERGQRGAGLGLSIVKEICDLHNARITLTSKVGEGTCVQLQFLQVRFR